MTSKGVRAWRRRTIRKLIEWTEEPRRRRESMIDYVDRMIDSKHLTRRDFDRILKETQKPTS